MLLICNESISPFLQYIPPFQDGDDGDGHPTLGLEESSATEKVSVSRRRGGKGDGIQFYLGHLRTKGLYFHLQETLFFSLKGHEFLPICPKQHKPNQTILGRHSKRVAP